MSWSWPASSALVWWMLRQNRSSSKSPAAKTKSMDYSRCFVLTVCWKWYAPELSRCDAETSVLPQLPHPTHCRNRQRMRMFSTRSPWTLVETPPLDDRRTFSERSVDELRRHSGRKLPKTRIRAVAHAQKSSKIVRLGPTVGAMFLTDHLPLRQKARSGPRSRQRVCARALSAPHPPYAAGSSFAGRWVRWLYRSSRSACARDLHSPRGDRDRCFYGAF